jgi:hypothetical protein
MCADPVDFIINCFIYIQIIWLLEIPIIAESPEYVEWFYTEVVLT